MSDQDTQFLSVEQMNTYIQNKHAKRTRYAYFNSLARFIGYLAFRAPQLVADTLISNLNEELHRFDEEQYENEDEKEARYFDFSEKNRQYKRKIKTWIQDLSNGTPIDLNRISPDAFVNWISKLKRHNGTALLKKTSYDVHKCAIEFLFEIHQHRIADEWKRLNDDMCGGFVRLNAEQTANTNERLITGKDALEFNTFIILMTDWQIQGNRTSVFAHTFASLCWNLMCRSSNVVHLCFNHLRWSGDSLQVYFAHSKTDQTGTHIRYPRHIYANALNPPVCPILSLAVYFSCFPVVEAQIKLFAGSSQYNRFSNLLNNRVERLQSTHSEFENLDIGTHSFRKGAKTYCASGSTIGPSSASILLRGGWTLGGSQDAYTEYQEAGDKYVGRYLSGLPTHNHEFAFLPPEFSSDIPNGLLTSALSRQFSILHTLHRQLAEYLLASLVYHSTYILANFDRNHAIRSTPLFLDLHLLQQLKDYVSVSNFKSQRLIATGIPPYATILYELVGMKDQISTIVPAVQEATLNTISGVIQELENRSVQLNTVTYDGLDERLRAAVQDILIDNGWNSGTVATINNEVNVNENSNYQIHLNPNGNGFLLLPPDYKIPQCTVPNVIYLYFYGNEAENIRPLKLISSRDFSNKNAGKRYSDLKYVVDKVMNEFEGIPTMDDINSRWQTAIQRYQLLSVSITANRVRRTNQMTWRTAEKLIRTSIRRRRRSQANA